LNLLAMINPLFQARSFQEQACCQPGVLEKTLEFKDLRDREPQISSQVSIF
jgi:hypothetical protein